MIAILTLIIVILDQITKSLVSIFSDKLPIEIIKGVFSINLVQNRGAAFGILQNQTIFFICISIIVIIVILWGQISVILPGVKKKSAPIRDRMLKISLSLILGGAVGNLIDRIRLGYVIDFLDFKIWPVFNVADSAITIGAVLLVFQLLLKPKTKNKK